MNRSPLKQSSKKIINKKTSSSNNHNGAVGVFKKHSSSYNERHLNHFTTTKSTVNINNRIKLKDGCRRNNSVIIKKNQTNHKMCDRINGTPTSGSARKRGHQHHPRNQGTRRSNVPAGEVIAALRRDFTADEVILQKVTDETNNNNQVKKIKKIIKKTLRK